MQFSKDLRSTKRGVEWPIVWGGGNSVVTSERVRVCVCMCARQGGCVPAYVQVRVKEGEREREPAEQNVCS